MQLSALRQQEICYMRGMRTEKKFRKPSVRLTSVPPRERAPFTATGTGRKGGPGPVSRRVNAQDTGWHRGMNRLWSHG